MKGFILRGTIGVIVFLIVTGIIGIMLPEEHSVTRSVKLHSAPLDVWQKIVNISDMPTWNPLISATEQRETHPELPSRWAITYTDGHHAVIENFVIEEQQLFSSIIKETSYPFSGRWVFELKPFGNNKTKLILTENLVIENPYWRLVAYIMGYETAIETFLSALATALKQPNTPIES